MLCHGADIHHFGLISVVYKNSLTWDAKPTTTLSYYILFTFSRLYQVSPDSNHLLTALQRRQYSWAGYVPSASAIESNWGPWIYSQVYWSLHSIAVYEKYPRLMLFTGHSRIREKKRQVLHFKDATSALKFVCETSCLVGG